MTPDARTTILVIGGMAAVTYAARAGGLVIARVLPATPFVTAFLNHLGTSVIVALVVATLARSDAPGLVAAAATVGLAAAGRPTTALLAGMAVAALLRL
ncbi:MAG: AzlD domain-containing protein [Acidobacteria bacterium]|nr:AzlD domain-containing protein [Acidobacteriota bacterium]